ncbi:hypothetical protein [Actinoplanes subtropicus]|uniref:hypothetical protein n=1 Tax=Actinoplanes subtropicus TaxID=543632 RepID=UPI0004C41351|nr:hypothetical protein [Actinoplanes subtropicus]
MVRYPDGEAPSDVDLGRVWVGVAGEVWARRPGPVERVAARLLRSRGLARALVTTPSLVAGWLAATVAVLGVGVAVTLSTGTVLVPLLAPALAGAGVAYAYGPGTDPAYELVRIMPVGDRMVLLVRALCVCLVNAVLGVAASAISGAATAITFGWLVPMTAVCALALAAATVMRSAPAGVAAGLAGWAIAVLGVMAARGSAAGAVTAVTDTALYLPYLAVAALGAVTVRLSKGTP